jgi:hypothetical protein
MFVTATFSTFRRIGRMASEEPKTTLPGGAFCPLLDAKPSTMLSTAIAAHLLGIAMLARLSASLALLLHYDQCTPPAKGRPAGGNITHRPDTEWGLAKLPVYKCIDGRYRTTSHFREYVLTGLLGDEI